MIPQTSPQWTKARLGHASASRMNDVLDVLKNGKPSQARRKYQMELVAERMCDLAVDHYVNDAMAFGLANEEAAKEEYEIQTGILLSPSGWYVHPRIEFLGATPDAEIGSDGLAEFKVPMQTTYAEWRIAGVVPEQHIAQMTCQLAVTGRKWCDFVAFNPRVQIGPRLFIRRFTPTAEQIATLESAAEAFLAEVEELFMRATREDVT